MKQLSYCELSQKNYDDWNTDEIFPEKKGGIHKLNNEAMKVASKELSERGVKIS